MSIASRVERLMLDLINKARADAGRDPLQLAVDQLEHVIDFQPGMAARHLFL